MTFGRAFFLFVLVSGSGGAGLGSACGLNAWALAAEPTREAVSKSVDDLLAQMHPRETVETWRALGPEAPGVLIEKYGQTTHSFKRARIRRALGAFDDPVAVEFLKKEALSQQNAAARGDALRAIGLSQGPKALDFLEGFLTHETPQTRLVAADVIRQMPGREARKAYEGFLAREKTPWVREKLERAEQWAIRSRPGARSSGESDGGFQGKWRGYWIAVEGTALRSLTAELEFRNDASAQLSVWPMAGGKKGKKARIPGPVQKFNLSGIQGAGSRVRGRIARDSEKDPSRASGFEAERGEARPGFQLLRLKTEDGSTLVAERAVPVPIPTQPQNRSPDR